MDPVSLLVGGGLVCAGWVIGRTGRLRRTVKDPDPECGCEHHLAMHDRTTGECHGTVMVPVRYNLNGSPTAREPVQCECRQYTGPVPVTEIWTPPTLPPTS